MSEKKTNTKEPSKGKNGNNIANFKGITLSVDNLSLENENGKLKPNFEVISCSIDVGSVKGAGGLYYNKDNKSFAGAIELSILNKFSVSALLALSQDPFSLAGLINTTFNPGIQIGMGFEITGLGGSLGLNRGLDSDKLCQAVHNSTLSTILFGRDIGQNFATIAKDLDNFYPVAKDQYYFGFLAQISYGTILKADLGLFLKFPDQASIIVAGIIKVHISDKSDDLLIINADFLGGIQFDKGIFFDASLHDSKIVGLNLDGDMAMRIFWGGETKGFILSIGGFHPQYTPESGFNLPSLKRISLNLDYKIVKFNLEAYFAITSNTIQFGSLLYIQIGFKKFGIIGYAAFNALFQFKPFRFLVDMSAGLAVKLGKCTLCSISLGLELEGPAQWHARGYANFQIIFEFTVDFDYTWGRKQEIEEDSKEVFKLFENEFNNKNNWSVIPSDLTDNMVTLQATEDEKETLLQSNGTIVFNQSAVPLNENMDFYNNCKIEDYKDLEIKELAFGDDKIKWTPEKSSFAPSLIRNMTDDEKLTSPSYQEMNGGFRLDMEEKNCGKIEATPAYSNEILIGKNNVEQTDSQSPRLIIRDTSIASQRRSLTGFRRYIKQFDQRKVKELSDLMQKL